MRPILRICFALLCTAALAIRAAAQNDPGPCAADFLRQQALLKYPDAAQRHETMEKAVRQFFQKNAAGGPESGAGGVIPVVVHIVHNDGPENISDARVQQAIAWLNESFANAGFFDRGSGAATQIQFCLAQRTPNNNPGNGIQRVKSPLTVLNAETQDGDLKALSRWNTYEYLNIWVVKDICSSGYGCGITAYAYQPTFHGSSIDGIVIEEKWFGSQQEYAALLAHETGHYLGLYHTFEGGCNNVDCLFSGDYVCDTPPDQSTAGVPCDQSANSCSTDTQSGSFLSDQPDPISNYMDYGNYACMHDFTPNQATRMQYLLQTERKSLLSSKGCQPPCTAFTTAGFSADQTTVGQNESVSFTNTSQNAASYTWTINGQPFSTAPNPSYTFTEVGLYTIALLVAPKDQQRCVADSSRMTIEVKCLIQADFSVSNARPSRGDTVTVAYANPKALETAWFLNGEKQTAGFSQFTAANPGIYAVRLVVREGDCTAEKSVFVFVQDSCDQGPFFNTYQSGISQKPASLTLLTDGSYLVVGSAVNKKGTPVAFFNKISENGAPLFSAEWGTDSNTPKFCADAAPTPDGGWIALLTTGKPTDPSVEAYAAQFAAEDGSLIWQRRLNLPANRRKALTRILPTSDGGYIICGSAVFTANREIYITKINKDGAPLWARQYGAPGANYEAFDITERSDGHFVAVGTDGVDGLIMDINATGEAVWQRHIYNNTGRLDINAVVETKDQYILAASAAAGRILALNHSGQIVWSLISDQNVISDIAAGPGQDALFLFNPIQSNPVPASILRLHSSGAFINKYSVESAALGSRIAVSPNEQSFVLCGELDKENSKSFLLKSGFTPETDACNMFEDGFSVSPDTIAGYEKAIQSKNSIQLSPVTIASVETGVGYLNVFRNCAGICDQQPDDCKGFADLYATEPLLASDAVQNLDGSLTIAAIQDFPQQGIHMIRTDARGKRVLSRLNTFQTGSLEPRIALAAYENSFTVGYGYEGLGAAALTNYSGVFGAQLIQGRNRFNKIIPFKEGVLALGGIREVPGGDENCTAQYWAPNTQASYYWGSANMESATCAQVLPDSSVLVSGSNETDGHVWLARLNPNLSFSWQRQIFHTGNQARDTLCGMLVVGNRIWHYGASNFNPQQIAYPWVVVTDAKGTVLWSKMYRINNELISTRFSSAVADHKGNVVLTVTNGSPWPSGIIMKLNPEGGVIWSHKYFSNANTRFSLHHIFRTADQGYLLSGIGQRISGRSGVVVASCDSLGYTSICRDAPHTITPVAIPVSLLTETVTPYATVNAQVNIPVDATSVTNNERYPLCSGCFRPEICDNGIDDDGDGLFDCLDDACVCGEDPCRPERTKRWYFGEKAGLDFSTEPPTVLTDGKTDASITTNAAISDERGNLLFYTDNRYVYNRFHEKILDYAIEPSQTVEESLIIPWPGQPGQFLLFSLIAGQSQGAALRVSLIDMRLNEGKGAIADNFNLKPLLNNIPLDFNISAVRACGFQGYWVLARGQNNNVFYAFRVDLNGLNTEPATSNAAALSNISWEMKFSPNGRYLARSVAMTTPLQRFIELYDFDAGTGIVSKRRAIPTSELPSGLDFSSDSRYLYALQGTRLFQYDVLSDDPVRIAQSALLIGTINSNAAGMQLAPNGKIYMTSNEAGFETRLHIVNRPNERGAACLFQLNGLSLTGTKGTLVGLCNVIAGDIRQPFLAIERPAPDTVCLSGAPETYRVYEPGKCFFSNITWRLYGLQGELKPSGNSVQVVYTGVGKGLLIAEGQSACGTAADTIQVWATEPSDLKLDLGPDQTVCDNGVFRFRAPAGFARYRWSTGSADSVLTTLFPGKYWLDVWDVCGRLQSDTITVTVLPETRLDLGPDLRQCPGEPRTYARPDFYSRWQWTPMPTGGCDTCRQITLDPKGTSSWIVTAQNETGCLSIDTLTIAIDTIRRQVDTVICANTVFRLLGREFQPDQTYNVRVEAPGGKGCDTLWTIRVASIPAPTLALPADTSLCIGDTIQIKATVSGGAFVWSPATGLSCTDCADPFVYTLETRIYRLTASSGNGCTVSDEITVTVVPKCNFRIPNAFTPDNDGYNDWFYPIADPCVHKVLSWRVYNRWGILQFERRDFKPNIETLGWDGMKNGDVSPMDTYIWVGEFEYYDGKKGGQKGEVTLLR